MNGATEVFRQFVNAAVRLFGNRFHPASRIYLSFLILTLAVLGTTQRIAYAAGTTSTIKVAITVDDLKINNYPDPYLYVTGYHTAGDGGGGTTYRNDTGASCTDNGGTVLLDGVGLGVHHCWTAMSFPTNILQWGAKDSPSHSNFDNGQIFHNLIAALKAAGLNGVTITLPGNYTFFTSARFGCDINYNAGDLCGTTLADANLTDTLFNLSGVTFAGASNTTITALGVVSGGLCGHGGQITCAAPLFQFGSSASPYATKYTASITSTNMNVTVVAFGTLAPGQKVNGLGVAAGTTISSQTSGTTGGTGVYVVAPAQSVSGESMTAPGGGSGYAQVLSGGLESLTLNGFGNANNCLQVIGLAQGQFRNITCENAVKVGVDIEYANTKSDTRQNRFDTLTIDETFTSDCSSGTLSCGSTPFDSRGLAINDTAADNQYGMPVQYGSPVRNTDMRNFKIATINGTAVRLGFVSGDTFIDGFLNNSGTIANGGIDCSTANKCYAVEFQDVQIDFPQATADNVGNGPAQHEMFWNVSGGSGTIRCWNRYQPPVDFTHPSFGTVANNIFEESTASGGANGFTTDPQCNISIQKDKGNTSGTIGIAGIFTAGVPMANTDGPVEALKNAYYGGTAIAANGSFTAGATQITSVSPTTIQKGYVLSGPNIKPGTTVTSTDMGGATLNLSEQLTGSTGTAFTAAIAFDNPALILQHDAVSPALALVDPSGVQANADIDITSGDLKLNVGPIATNSIALRVLGISETVATDLHAGTIRVQVGGTYTLSKRASITITGANGSLFGDTNSATCDGNISGPIKIADATHFYFSSSIYKTTCMTTKTGDSHGSGSDLIDNLAANSMILTPNVSTVSGGDTQPGTVVTSCFPTTCIAPTLVHLSQNPTGTGISGESLNFSGSLNAYSYGGIAYAGPMLVQTVIGTTNSSTKTQYQVASTDSWNTSSSQLCTANGIGGSGGASSSENQDSVGLFSIASGMVTLSPGSTWDSNRSGGLLACAPLNNPAYVVASQGVAASSYGARITKTGVVVSNASGVIKLQFATTGDANTLNNGHFIVVSGSSTDANGVWPITWIDGQDVTLNGSTFVTGQSHGNATVSWFDPAVNIPPSGSATRPNPSSGWSFFTDAADSKLKAIKYDGTIQNVGSVASVAPGAGIATTNTGGNSAITASGTVYVDASYFPMFIGGLALSNDPNSSLSDTVFDVTSGSATSDDNSVLMKQTALTKTTGGWTSGSGNGCLDTGSVAASSWYHVFLVERPDTGATDIVCSLSATTPTPTLIPNYSKHRRVGSFATDGSSHIRGFQQDGETFYWAGGRTKAVQAASLTSSAAVLLPLDVPTGVKAIPLCAYSMSSTAAGAVTVLLSSPDEADDTPTTTVPFNPAVPEVGFDMLAGSGQLNTTCPRMHTNIARQIRIHSSNAGNATAVSFDVRGWQDCLNPLCPYPYRAEALSYFGKIQSDCGLVLSDAFKHAVNDYVDAEILSSNWGNQDAEYIFATTSSCVASINLAQPTLHKIDWTVGSGCSFTVANGLNGNGSSCYGIVQDKKLNEMDFLSGSSGYVEAYVGANTDNDLGLDTTAGTFRLLNKTSRNTRLASTTDVVDSSDGAAGLAWGRRTDTTYVYTGNGSTSLSSMVSAPAATLSSVKIVVCKMGTTGFCANGVNERFVGWGAAMNSTGTHFDHVRALLVALGATP